MNDQGTAVADSRIRRRRELRASAGVLYRQVSRYASYARLVSRMRLAAYRRRFEGRRCFVIGNGPSLADTDLTRLRHEITFGANRLYPLFDRLGFATTFYVAVDPLVVQHYHGDIDRLETIKFLPARHRHRFTFDSRTIFFEEAAPLTFAYKPQVTGVWDGGSVTYVSLQLAHFMGCDPVYVIGLDHNYSISKSHHDDRTSLVEIATGRDRHHFAADYFAPGVAWSVPNLELKELGYRMALFAYRRQRRRVFDATIDGHLDVFPKVDYRSLF